MSRKKEERKKERQKEKKCHFQWPPTFMPAAKGIARTLLGPITVSIENHVPQDYIYNVVNIQTNLERSFSIQNPKPSGYPLSFRSSVQIHHYADRNITRSPSKTKHLYSHILYWNYSYIYIGIVYKREKCLIHLNLNWKILFYNVSLLPYL